MLRRHPRHHSETVSDVELGIATLLMGVIILLTALVVPGLP